MTPPEYKTYSLRRALLIALLTAATAIWGVTAYNSYLEAREEVAELFDAELAQNSRIIRAFVENSLERGVRLEGWRPAHAIGRLGTDIFGHKYEKKVAFQLWDQRDRLILRSASSPLFPLSSAKQGFSQTSIDGRLWHVFTLPDKEGRFVIRVGQRDDIRGELTNDISRQLLKQFLIGMPLLAIAIWFIVGRSLQTLTRLALAVKARGTDHLAPIEARKIPTEVRPLVDSLNSLLARLEKAFEKERRFTADASHELRTPLAGLKTQAQVALRTPDEEVRRNALGNILKAVEQMTRLVEQLLLLARIEQEPEIIQRQRLSLPREIERALSELTPLAAAKHVAVAFDQKCPCDIDANKQLLGILARNLIDNAIRYTTEYGRIEISIACSGNAAHLRIEDSGPGIPEELRSRVFQRFYRGVETANETPGSGLGLSIAERIATINGATIELGDSSLGGLLATVSFALPKAPGADIPLGKFNIVKKSNAL